MDFYLRPIVAQIHTIMHPMFSKVPCENIGKMKLFKLVDLPFFLMAGPAVASHTYSNLKTFQSNLVEREWPSLADIYPRSMMWFYAYNLFFWSRYCKILPTVLRHPDRCLPAEVYLRYICQIDTYLDSFDSRGLLDNLIEQIESQPEIQAVLADLTDRLKISSGDHQDNTFLGELLDTYLRHNLPTIRQWMASEKMTLADIQDYKETVTGELYLTWSRMLGHIFEVDEQLSENAARIISRYGMATQVVDDITDAKQDYLVSSPNVFLGIAAGHPVEYKRLIHHISKRESKYMHWPWLRKNVPQSFEQTISLIHAYLADIRTASLQKPLTDEPLKLVARLIALAG